MLLNTSLLTLLLLAITTASPIAKRSPKHLSFSIEKEEKNDNSNVKGKRTSSETLPLENTSNYAYYIHFGLGSNKTPIRAQIDSGSYSFWVPESTTGDSLNKFDAFKSTTFKNESKSYAYYYNGGDSIQGYWGNDDLWLSDTNKLPKYEFGTVYKYTRSTPLIGISQLSSENYNYSIANSMKNAGLIDHSAISIDLSTSSNKNGNLLFGAIDKAKYEGKMGILNTTDGSKAVINSISFENGKNFNTKTKVLLDTGSSASYFKKDALDPILNEISGGNLNSNYDFDCSLINQNKNLTFNFDGISINVPYSDLFYPYGSVCKSYLVVGSSSILWSDWAVLGDHFLRHAYTAFNFDTEKVGIAQAVHNNDETDLIDFYF
ncbi:uncharacterized protein KGF55_001617 [Candida pseudojiufengensis]|uniref:uncharacterized protein n=1 Tax=Candida pseudojiufengensis TaxID=497109 RepID=UPI00222407CB|nr:uncharacterized protein KGF55_001617 [Candida pseudojiufengensis]KAI5965396.1 hypothetical protein KGF55_001617 [Candida pseudojiufengensis]